MPAHRYVEENSPAAMLGIKRSVGVTPEVNLGMCKTPTSPPSMNKVAHSGLKLKGDISRSPNRGISGPTKKTCVFQNYF